MTKQCYGVALSDLVKAFERVPHAKGAQAAAERGYPAWILRLSLDAYRMERTLVIDNACSRDVLPSCGITAGSGFATDELCLLMLEVMDQITAIIPRVVCALYVDDISMETTGGPGRLLERWRPRRPSSGKRSRRSGSTSRPPSRWCYPPWPKPLWRLARHADFACCQKHGKFRGRH